MVTGGKPRQIRSLTTSQINRIVERQVEFFRSAQRQSFLRGSQMGGGTGGMPSPARSGLQSVTQEMRTALQRMVLSTSQEQVLLDAVEQGVEQEIRRQNQKVQRDASQAKGTAFIHRVIQTSDSSVMASQFAYGSTQQSTKCAKYGRALSA